MNDFVLFDLFTIVVIINGIIFDIYIFNHMKPVKYDEAYQCAKDKIKYAIQEDHTIDFFNEHFEMVNVSIIKYNWNKTLVCLNESSVYYPFTKPPENVLAYVYPRLNYFYPNRIFVHKEHFNSVNLNEQANTLIHECTHLAFNTLDYGYRDQEHTYLLRGKKAFKNADTHVLILNIIKNNFYY